MSMPMELIMAIMASAMAAAIRPYSMAVAPDSLARSLKQFFFNFAFLRLRGKFRRETMPPQNLRLSKFRTIN
jgi:hypothetical protein